MDERTPEQKFADNALEDALQEVAKAYDYISDGEIITSWIAVGSAVGFEAPSRTTDTFFIVTPNQHMSPYISIGLLRYGQITIENATVAMPFTLYEGDDDEFEEDEEGMEGEV